jgi:hypothetical protein
MVFVLFAPFCGYLFTLCVSSVAFALPFAQRLDARLELGAIRVEVVRAIVSIRIADVVEVIRRGRV